MVANSLPWPNYPIEKVAFTVALALWLSMILNRYADWRAVARLEKGLDRDELEREIERTLVAGGVTGHGECPRFLIYIPLLQT